MTRRTIRMPGPSSGFAGPEHRRGYTTGSISRAIQWIALNDEPSELDAEVVAESISCLLVADLFDKEPIEVARTVVKHRGGKT
jgi:hypothetical protein